MIVRFIRGYLDRFRRAFKRAGVHTDWVLSFALLKGTMVAAGYLDLGQFAQKRGEEHDMKVMLKPSGVLNVRILLEDVVEGDGAHSTDVSSNSQCVTPEFQSEVSEESQVSEQIGVDAAQDPQEASSNHKVTGKPERVVVDRARDATHSPSASNTMSSTSTLSYGDGLEEPGSHRSLESKLRRAQRQCEEARARAFSEASVALQRGIEIDNLKRAKDVLLRRLETAEQQLMTMMKQELAMTIQETDKSSATLLGMDTVIQQLASTKVALAEKEFEMMELNGKLKARDAHIQALLMHLDAIKESSLLTARSTSAEVGLKNDNREASDPVADGEEAREAGEPLDKPLDKSVDDPLHKHAQLPDEIKSPHSEEQEGGDRISDDDQPLKAANTLPTMTVRIHASTV